MRAIQGHGRVWFDCGGRGDGCDLCCDVVCGRSQSIRLTESTAAYVRVKDACLVAEIQTAAATNKLKQSERGGRDSSVLRDVINKILCIRKKGFVEKRRGGK